MFGFSSPSENTEGNWKTFLFGGWKTPPLALLVLCELALWISGDWEIGRAGLSLKLVSLSWNSGLLYEWTPALGVKVSGGEYPTGEGRAELAGEEPDRVLLLRRGVLGSWWRRSRARAREAVTD